MKQNYKGILGLNTIKLFIIVLLSLAIIGVVTLVIIGSLTSDSILSTMAPISSGSVVNETQTAVNNTGVTLAYSSNNGYLSSVCSGLVVTNETNAVIISSGNYTTSNSGCIINGSLSEAKFNNSIWKFTYSYSYRDSNGIRGISNNVSNGITGLFGNAGVFFSLLGVVVIILIISLVVVVVNRFGGGSSSQANPSL